MNGEPLARLSDADLHARIERHSQQMLQAHARYLQSSDIEDRAERDNAHLAIKQARRELARRTDAGEDGTAIA
jgi:multidrug resistance efflux pump